VVLTGEMRRPREEWTELIIAAGLECGGVTKRTKAVVAADPDSVSGKAEKARAYGVPVVTEAAFAEAFDRYVAARG
jgi:DNA polymerase-3 subunit epsilon